VEKKENVKEGDQMKKVKRRRKGGGRNEGIIVLKLAMKKGINVVIKDRKRK
jgi:hypothetical protein